MGDEMGIVKLICISHIEHSQRDGGSFRRSTTLKVTHGALVEIKNRQPAKTHLQSNQFQFTSSRFQGRSIYAI